MKLSMSATTARPQSQNSRFSSKARRSTVITSIAIFAIESWTTRRVNLMVICTASWITKKYNLKYAIHVDSIL